MGNRVTETFFLPDEVRRSVWTLPADLCNLTRTLLARSDNECVFVPIRSMQYLGIITRAEIVFVDSQAYACHGKEGGRLIMLAWKITGLGARASLDAPVACEVIEYHPAIDDIKLRIVGAFREAMQLLDRRFRESSLPSGGARIVKLDSRNRP